MRLRKISGAIERLEKNKKFYALNPEESKGVWSKTVFKNDNPLQIEVGCGKGGYIIGLAKTFPEVNFVAIEKYDSVLLRVLEKIEEDTIPNLRILVYDAGDLNKIFAKGEVSIVYLNFSDPWPKNKHYKRRLTSSVYLKEYKDILVKGGLIVQKTDNMSLFESSLESLSLQGWSIFDISLDLHKTDIFNIMTEYEEKWSPKGPIYKLSATLDYKNRVDKLNICEQKVE